MLCLALVTLSRLPRRRLGLRERLAHLLVGRAGALLRLDQLLAQPAQLGLVLGERLAHLLTCRLLALERRLLVVLDGCRHRRLHVAQLLGMRALELRDLRSQSECWRRLERAWGWVRDGEAV